MTLTYFWQKSNWKGSFVVCKFISVVKKSTMNFGVRLNLIDFSWNLMYIDVQNLIYLARLCINNDNPLLKLEVWWAKLTKYTLSHFPNRGIVKQDVGVRQVQNSIPHCNSAWSCFTSSIKLAPAYSCQGYFNKKIP